MVGVYVCGNLFNECVCVFEQQRFKVILRHFAAGYDSIQTQTHTQTHHTHTQTPHRHTNHTKTHTHTHTHIHTHTHTHTRKHTHTHTHYQTQDDVFLCRKSFIFGKVFCLRQRKICLIFQREDRARERTEKEREKEREREREKEREREVYILFLSQLSENIVGKAHSKKRESWVN